MSLNLYSRSTRLDYCNSVLYGIAATAVRSERRGTARHQSYFSSEINFSFSFYIVLV